MDDGEQAGPADGAVAREHGGAAPAPGAAEPAAPAVVAVARAPGAAAADLLDAALADLDVDLAALVGSADEVAVLAAAPDPVTGVDPSLLARLCERLEEAGTTAVRVLRPEDARAPAAVPPGSVLGQVALPVAWATASVRVVVTGATTDAAEGYAGVGSQLAALLPDDCAVPAAEAVTDLLRLLPPHLAVVDAAVASDGCFGSVRAAPRPTGTVVAGTSALVVDDVLAALMGLDPAGSPLVGRVLDELGLPVPRSLRGDARPWEGWQPAPPELVAACQRAAAAVPGFPRVLAAVAADEPADEGDVVLREARRWWRPAVGRVDTDPVARAWLVALAEGVAAAGTAARAWSTVAVKDRVPRQQVSLGLDLGRYRPADYDEVADYLAPLMALAEQAPLRSPELRWRRHGGGVLFVAERDVAAPYDAFVARVDPSRAIRLMNDYVGGCAVVVARDEQGRVLRQAERNRYLPQPNYLAFWGGEVIDVCKLEVLRYADGESRIAWRTVRSPNGSAVHDDGAVVFRDVGDGRTRVSVYGLQEFVLPPFWQAVDLARWSPALHDALTDDAYRRFFTATLDQFEACYEGREVVTGREPQRDPELPTSRLSRTLRFAAAALAPDEDEDSSARSARPVDDDGFVHVAGQPAARVELLDRPAREPSPWAGFAAGLRRALEQDLGRDAGP